MCNCCGRDFRSATLDTFIFSNDKWFKGGDGIEETEREEITGRAEIFKRSLDNQINRKKNCHIKAFVVDCQFLVIYIVQDTRATMA